MMCVFVYVDSIIIRKKKPGTWLINARIQAIHVCVNVFVCVCQKKTSACIDDEDHIFVHFSALRGPTYENIMVN